MATFKHSLQLAQLRRFDPAAARRAETILDNAPALAAKLITETMQKIFDRLTSPVERLWQTIESKIDRQDLPIRSGQKIEIGHLNGRSVYLYRRSDDSLALQCGLGITSRPIATWGRDWDHLSSAYAGRWKFTPGARRNFEMWLES